MAQVFDYDSYIVNYSGTLDEESFDRYSKRAFAFLSNVTMGRSDCPTDDKIADKINLTACDIMSAMIADDAPGGGVVSESNDGVSVTYASSKDSRTAAQRYFDIAVQYLSSSGLLYRGVRKC